MTRRPGSPKNRRTLKGDASIGRNAAKYRASLNGHNSAAPWPALVHVSKSGWDTAQTNKYNHGPMRLQPVARE